MENITKEEFIGFLKDMARKIPNVAHYSKTNEAYNTITDLLREIDYKCVSYYQLGWEELIRHSSTANLIKSAKILNQYSHKGSDKRKIEVLKEFKSEYVYDLNHLIYNLELEPSVKTID